MIESSRSRQMFIKRILLSTLAIFAVALISSGRTMAADVFVDEGDNEFDKPTPVETPSTGASLDLDADFAAGKPGDSADPAATAVTPLDAPVIDTSNQNIETAQPQVAEVPAKKEAAPKAARVNKPKAATKNAKKTASAKSSKSTKKTTTASKSSSKGKKAVAAGKPSSKSASKAAKSKSKSASDKKSSKRKVASTVKYAGGQYVTTSRECAMESAPGAGDSVGTTKSQRKLWVEDAGDGGYWKVYSKSGQAAFLSRSCF